LFKALALTFFLAASASADRTVEVENKSYWICKNQKQVRTIRVHVDQAGVCSTYYSKQGEEKVVGSGRNHESCGNFLNNIKTNLEKSSWTCRDITPSRITASVEEKAPQ
jgi:hypothetical protein